MKLLLMISALLEVITGVVLFIVSAVAVSELLGVPLDTPGGLVAGRIAGAALIALAIAALAPLLPLLLLQHPIGELTQKFFVRLTGL